MLLDYELKSILEVFGKNWADIISESDIEPKNCPRPQREKQNLSGAQIRQLRTELGWSQEKLMTKLQVAGWDIDRTVVIFIENEQRPLLDYELKFFLDALGKDWDGIFKS